MANKPAKLLGLAHIGIYTKDLEASKAFYTKLGFRLDGESCPGAKLAFMSLGSCLLELIQPADPAAQLPGDGVVAHVAIECTGIDELVASLKAQGAGSPAGPGVHLGQHPRRHQEHLLPRSLRREHRALDYYRRP